MTPATAARPLAGGGHRLFVSGLVVAMALGDWVIPFVYNQTIGGFRYTVHSWLLLGALAAMQRVEAD